MSEIEARTPVRPLIWPDFVVDIGDVLIDDTTPVYLVGGAVRDAYLHVPVKDIDLVTPQDAVGIGRKIANVLGGAFYVMDAERGVARAIIELNGEHVVIDIARFRGNDLMADLSARDFTINAMAVDLRGDLSQIFDPLNGEQDLRDRVIRRCSVQSLPEDPIRGLRAVRQSVQFGARIEPDTLSDIRAVAANIANTSPERVRDELMRLFASRAPARALRVAEVLSLLNASLPEVASLKAQPFTNSPNIHDTWTHVLQVVEKMRAILNTIGPQRTEQTASIFGLGMIVMSLDPLRADLQKHILHEWPNERPHAALLILAVLLQNIDGSVTTVVERHVTSLRLSNGEDSRLKKALHGYSLLGDVDPDDNISLHRFWRVCGDGGIDACLLAMAEHLGTRGSALDQDEWVLFLERIQGVLAARFRRYDEIVEPPPLIDGNLLITALQIQPGRFVGELLDAVREAQVRGEVDTEAQALQFARAYMADRSQDF